MKQWPMFKRSSMNAASMRSSTPRRVQCDVREDFRREVLRRVLEWKNYSKNVLENFERMLGTSPSKLSMQIIFGDDTPERQANTRRNLIEERLAYWMITAERPQL
jgi:hypothetical protein